MNEQDICFYFAINFLHTIKYPASQLHMFVTQTMGSLKHVYEFVDLKVDISGILIWLDVGASQEQIWPRILGFTYNLVYVRYFIPFVHWG